MKVSVAIADRSQGAARISVIAAGFAIAAAAVFGAVGPASADKLVSMVNRADFERSAAVEILRDFPMPGDPADAVASFNELLVEKSKDIEFAPESPVIPAPPVPPSIDINAILMGGDISDSGVLQQPQLPVGGGEVPEPGPNINALLMGGDINDAVGVK